jgi:heme-degrading monooxygenase HmoA
VKVAQFFEVDIKEGLRDRYMELAASLRPGMDAMGGCLFIDRFQSLTRKNTLLSYQIWQDEASMTAWRSDGTHHSVQTLGRDKIFSDYRIRIAQVVYEARPGGSTWRPERLTPYNDPSRRPRKFVLAFESANATSPAPFEWANDSFGSMYRPGRFAHLMDLPSYAAGVGLEPTIFSDSTTEYLCIFEVMRDYGMYDRAQAPQYYPPACTP